MSQNHMTKYFRKTKRTPSSMTAEQKLPFHLYSRLRSIGVRFNRHGNCTTATVDTTVLGKFKAAYISRTTVELNTVHSYKENRIQQRVLRTFYGQ